MTKNPNELTIENSVVILIDHLAPLKSPQAFRLGCLKTFSYFRRVIKLQQVSSSSIQTAHPKP